MNQTIFFFFKSNNKLFGPNDKITWKATVFIELKIGLLGPLQKLELWLNLIKFIESTETHFSLCISFIMHCFVFLNEA